MPRTRRPGYTILELVAVLAVIVILGAVVIPSLTGFYGNTRQRAAADTLRARLAEARAKAIERGAPFRVAVHADKTRLRVAPDGDDFDSLAADDPPAFDSLATEDALTDGVTLDLELEPDDERLPSPAGWTTLVTFRQDGTAREGRPATAVVREKDFAPIRVQVRGVTGQTRTTTGAKAGSGGQP